MKKIVLSVALCLPHILFAQKIEGVVTYFFNDNFGYKPDIGAKVYIFPDSTDATLAKADSFGKKDLKIKPEIIDSFLTGKAAWANYQLDLTRYNNIPKRKRTEEDEQALAKSFESSKSYGITNEAERKSFDKRAYLQLLDIERSKNTINTVVDGSGKYSIEVPTGSYYVFIISQGRTSVCLLEITGRVHFQKAQMHTNELKNVSTQFDLY